eukprot:851284-Prymnesium_polylepis.1
MRSTSTCGVRVATFVSGTWGYKTPHVKRIEGIGLRGPWRRVCPRTVRGDFGTELLPIADRHFTWRDMGAYRMRCKFDFCGIVPRLVVSGGFAMLGTYARKAAALQITTVPHCRVSEARIGGVLPS